MNLLPAEAKRWLPPGVRYQDWLTHGAMMLRRREALGVLVPVYASWLRLGIGVLAWAAGIGAGVVAGRALAADGNPASLVAVALLLLASGLGLVVTATGSAVARAIASWWGLATVIRDDGGLVHAAGVSPQTEQLHEQVRSADRRDGAGELWRPPLLPRTLAALLTGGLGVAAVVRALLDLGEVTVAYASAESRGDWLTTVTIAVVSLVAAALTASGLRRVHRARMHRVAQPEDFAYAAARPAATGQMPTGAIVVGGRDAARPAADGPSPAGPPLATAPLVDPPPAAPLAAPPLAAPPPATTDTAPPATTDTAPPALAGADPVAQTAPATRPAPEPAAPPVAPGAARPVPVVPADGAAPVPTVMLADGRRLAPGTTIVGRAPQPRDGERVDATLAVDDAQVSKNHLTVQLGPGEVVVTDRGSTNGSVVHGPDGPWPLAPGEPATLADGDVVVLGVTTLVVGEPAEDVEHTVLRAPAGKPGGGPGH
ncbi:FHA domain-containing protein [Georgenia sp. MJ170]|uniref:FHA domain-containing protein n=1 Tax=Georgenia sunbinii TaxID=3117728 RepID=UPI002F263103